MEISNNFQNINSLKKEKNINFKNKTIPIQQMSEAGLKVASAAITSLAIASIVIRNKQLAHYEFSNVEALNEEILSSLKENLPKDVLDKIVENNDIDYLKKLYHLSKIKGVARNGEEINIFENYNLCDLTNNINLDDAIELAQTRYEDENGVSKIRWNGSEIIELLKSNINIKSDEFKKLSSFMHKYANLGTTGYRYGDENNYYPGAGHLAPRFNYHDITKFLKSNIDINSQRFNDLLNAEVIDSSGNVYPLFNNSYEIIIYLESDANIENLIKIVQLTYHDTKGNTWPFFQNYKDEIEVSKRDNIDDFIRLINQQVKDNDTGITHSRFAQHEIRSLIKSNIDFKLINEISNMPLKDIYNREVEKPSMNMIIKKAQMFEANDKEIKENIKNIDDIELRSILEKQYNNLSIKQKLEQQDLFISKIDAYNNLTGKYLTFNYIVGRDNPQWHQFIKYCKDNNIELKDEGTTANLYFDFIEQQKVESFIELCNASKKLNITQDEALDYMYEEIYVKNSFFPSRLSNTTKNMLIKINQNFGTKVILPSFGEYIYYIEYIKKELEEWDIASSGQAKYPPVIDLLQSKVNYIDNTSAYGKSRSSGFCRSKESKYIAIDGYQNIENALRHELMHANDLKLLSTFPHYFNIDKEEVYNEFKAGDPNISWSHFEYAFNNPKEFIAVAAEGDMSKYSQWFIDKLIELGMPVWAVNLQKH